MANAPDPTTPGARFPWAATVFACACVAAAAWTYMLYSYAWPVTPSRLEEWRAEVGLQGVEHWYVTLTGNRDPEERTTATRWMSVIGASAERDGVFVLDHPRGADCVQPGEQVVCTGRVYGPGLHVPGRRMRVCIGCAASRWTGASVAGLVVGAMGVFIFTLHLRRWLGVRRLAADADLSAEKGPAA